MPKSLFHPNLETYTAEGNAFAKTMQTALDPIIAEAVEKGVSLRDLDFVLTSEVSLAISVAIITRNMAARRASQLADKDR